MNFSVEYVQRIECTEFLHKAYPVGLNPDISRVSFCQDGTSVWLELTRKYDTCFGTVSTREIFDLDFIVDFNGPMYTGFVNIEKNALHFLGDTSTLFYATTIMTLVDADDTPEASLEKILAACEHEPAYIELQRAIRAKSGSHRDSTRC